ncbi:MAG: hypothetical protein LBD25_08065 [Coriobacteriales bacterium]|jgi:hypothetical protein|nr:hypothetical protein [Coriobacteriales bacterium]
MTRAQTRRSDTRHKGRIGALKLARTLLYAVLLAGAVALGIGGVTDRMTGNEVRFVHDAVIRSSVQCYAVEGRYPPSIAYLEERYGLLIDHSRYLVYYEPVGSNLLPQVNVMAVAR